MNNLSSLGCHLFMFKLNSIWKKFQHHRPAWFLIHCWKSFSFNFPHTKIGSLFTSFSSACVLVQVVIWVFQFYWTDLLYLCQKYWILLRPILFLNLFCCRFSVLNEYCFAFFSLFLPIFFFYISAKFEISRLAITNSFRHTRPRTSSLNGFFQLFLLFQFTVLELGPCFLSLKYSQLLVEVCKNCLFTVYRFAYLGFCWYFLRNLNYMIIP